MSIQIGICDDNREDILALSEALNSYDASFKLISYTDGESLLEDLMEHKIHFDILFLDIYMPGLNGIEIARKIRARMKDTKIIFISYSNEHYPEAYDVFAFNYILKPLHLDKLNHVLDQALTDNTKERGQQLSFIHKAKTYRIFCQDIQYIESRNRVICFYMANKTMLQCYAKLDDIVKQLPKESFIRCHQSFAVNIFHVTEMTNTHFRIDSVTISISKKYAKAAKDKYFTFFFHPFE